MNVDYAVNLYEKLENTLGFDLGVNYIKIRDSWYDSVYYHKSRRISISSNIETRQELKEHLYHEIAHSLWRLERNKIPKSYFKIFTSGAKDG